MPFCHGCNATRPDCDFDRDGKTYRGCNKCYNGRNRRTQNQRPPASVMGIRLPKTGPALPATNEQPFSSVADLVSSATPSSVASTPGPAITPSQAGFAALTRPLASGYQNTVPALSALNHPSALFQVNLPARAPPYFVANTSATGPGTTTSQLGFSAIPHPPAYGLQNTGHTLPASNQHSDLPQVTLPAHATPYFGVFTSGPGSVMAPLQSGFGVLTPPPVYRFQNTGTSTFAVTTAPPPNSNPQINPQQFRNQPSQQLLGHHQAAPLPWPDPSTFFTQRLPSLEEMQQMNDEWALLSPLASGNRFEQSDYWRLKNGMEPILSVPFTDPCWPLRLRNHPRFGYRFDSPNYQDYPPWVRINFLQTQCLWLWRQTYAAQEEAERSGVDSPFPPWFEEEEWDPTGLHRDYSHPAREFPPHMWAVREREMEPMIRKLLARRGEIVDGKYGKLHVE